MKKEVTMVIRIILGYALVMAIWYRVDWTVGLFALLTLAYTEISTYNKQ